MQLNLATAEDLARVEGKVDKLLSLVQPPPEWISVEEYMDRKNVSKSTVYRQIKAGELQARGIGKTREVKL